MFGLKMKSEKWAESLMLKVESGKRKAEGKSDVLNK